MCVVFLCLHVAVLFLALFESQTFHILLHLCWIKEIFSVKISPKKSWGRKWEKFLLLFWNRPWICFTWLRCIFKIKNSTQKLHSEVLEDLRVISLHTGAYSLPAFYSGNFIITIVELPRGPFKLPSFHFHLYCSLSSVTFGCASPWQRTLALMSDSDIIQSISAQSES